MLLTGWIGKYFQLASDEFHGQFDLPENGIGFRRLDQHRPAAVCDGNPEQAPWMRAGGRFCKPAATRLSGHFSTASIRRSESATESALPARYNAENYRPGEGRICKAALQARTRAAARSGRAADAA